MEEWKLLLQAVPILFTILALAVQTGFLLSRLGNTEKQVDLMKDEVTKVREETERRCTRLEIDQGKLDVSQRALLTAMEQVQNTMNRMEDKIDKVLGRRE